jgi:hypothetical protein
MNRIPDLPDVAGVEPGRWRKPRINATTCFRAPRSAARASRGRIVKYMPCMVCIVIGGVPQCTM